MFLGPALHNEFNQKRHKVHMKAIIGEMKAKNHMDGFDFDDIDQQNHPSFKTIKRITKGTPTLKEEPSQKSIESRHSLKQRKYRSSRISIKLDEIVKYAEMFPSERERRSTKLKKTEDFMNLIEKQKIKESGFKNRRGGILIQKKPINKELLLNFQIVPQKLSEPIKKKEGENFRQSRVKKLIEEHKKQKKIIGDFSMRNFIEEEIHDLANASKNQRNSLPSKTEEKSLLNYSFYEKKAIDVRNENIHKIYRFIRGGQVLDTEEYSDYVSMDEMQKNRRNFKIYEKIHENIKNNLFCEKINVNNLYSQTLKNVIYLSEAITQETNIDRKSQIKKAIKRLKIHL